MCAVSDQQIQFQVNCSSQGICMNLDPLVHFKGALDREKDKERIKNKFIY